MMLMYHVCYYMSGVKKIVRILVVLKNFSQFVFSNIIFKFRMDIIYHKDLGMITLFFNVIKNLGIIYFLT